MKRRILMPFSVLALAIGLTTTGCASTAPSPRAVESPASPTVDSAETATACEVVGRLASPIHEASIGLIENSIRADKYSLDITTAQNIAKSELGETIHPEFAALVDAVAALSPTMNAGTIPPYEQLDTTLQPVRALCLENGTEVVLTMQGG